MRLAISQYKKRYRRGLESERDLLPGVEGGAFESGLTSEGVLNGCGHEGAGFIFT